MSTTSGRNFRGVSAEQRTAARRQQLQNAALSLLASQGWEGTTMTAICRAAGLTERYFYESFANRDALLLDLIDGVAARLNHAVVSVLRQAPADDVSKRLEAIARATIGIVVEDPRLSSLMLLDVVGHADFQRRKRDIWMAFEDLVKNESVAFFGDKAPSGIKAELVAISMVGAVGELLTRRADGSLGATDEELVLHIRDFALQAIQP